MNLPKWKELLPGRQNSEPPSGISKTMSFSENGFFTETNFDHLLHLEQKRTERSKKPFLLMLLRIDDLLSTREDNGLIGNFENALASCIRETDIKGWYQQDKTIGIIFTEMGTIDEFAKKKVFLKIQEKLCQALGVEAARKIKISYHVFPEAYPASGECREWFNFNLYPELTKKNHGKRVPFLVKRAIDLTGSLLGLIILSPAFALIALAIRSTSKGPVLFKQERIGQGGKRFTFLKFRSMYTNCDEIIHKEYVTKLITQREEDVSNRDLNCAPAIYKLKDDSRITFCGKFLRKTSLDELPQFINVLKGEMSLVGPRPPIPYECEVYDVWHRRRLLEVKPGITGLWQVEGRSRRTFDEMVRLDLKYINEWSLWLDLKILLKTPWVMITGSGGY